MSGCLSFLYSFAAPVHICPWSHAKAGCSTVNILSAVWRATMPADGPFLLPGQLPFVPESWAQALPSLLCAFPVSKMELDISPKVFSFSPHGAVIMKLVAIYADCHCGVTISEPFSIPFKTTSSYSYYPSNLQPGFLSVFNSLLYFPSCGENFSSNRSLLGAWLFCIKDYWPGKQKDEHCASNSVDTPRKLLYTDSFTQL